MAFDSTSLLPEWNFSASGRPARLRVTSQNAEIIDLNVYRERRTVAAMPVRAALASVQGRITPSPFAMAMTFVFWPMWVFGSFVLADEDEDGFGVA